MQISAYMQSAFAQVPLAWPVRAREWHERAIYSFATGKYLAGEQFWGRAVRASFDP